MLKNVRVFVVFFCSVFFLGLFVFSFQRLDPLGNFGKRDLSKFAQTRKQEENRSTDDLIPFNSEDGLIFVDSGLISSGFGKDEYHCTGTCICNEEENNRRVSNAISKSVFTLVAAVSGYLAYKLAKESFFEECKDIYSGTCQMSNIQSIVRKCEKKTEYDEENEKSNPDEKIEDIRKYFCTGSCIHKKLNSVNAIKEAKKFECSMLKKKGMVIMNCREKGPRWCQEQARRKFGKDKLVQYCKRNSRFDYYYDRKDGTGQWERVSACIGGYRNLTIRCIQVFPKYSKNASWRNWNTKRTLKNPS